MVQKCANPKCSAIFRYANRGRLFSFEIRNPVGPCRDVPPAICERKPSHIAINFWLCDDCSRTLSVEFNAQTGVSIVARVEGLRAQRALDHAACA